MQEHEDKYLDSFTKKVIKKADIEAPSIHFTSEIMSQVVSEKLLFTLWNAMKLDQIIDSTYTTSINGTSKYSRKTQDWKIMGWQKDDPVLDLKSSGTLAIECMSHFARNYPEAVNDMLGT